MCDAMRKGRAALKIYQSATHRANRASIRQLTRMALSESSFLAEIDSLISRYLRNLKDQSAGEARGADGLAGAISAKEVASVCGAVDDIRCKLRAEG